MSKVLFVIIQKFNPTMGGVERSTYRIGMELLKRGYEVGVFSFEKSNGDHLDVELDKFEIYNASDDGLNKNDSNRRRLNEVLHSFQPDHVINQMPYEHDITRTLKEAQSGLHFSMIACLRQTLFSVKDNIDNYIVRMAPSSLSFMFKNPLGRRAFQTWHWYSHRKSLKYILSSYNKFTFYAEPNYKELSYFIKDFDAKKIATIPNSLPFISPSVPEKEKTILWLGRLVYKQKRADFILPLWRELKDRLPDWTMDVVGEGGAYDDLKAQVVQENIEGITLHGRQIPDDYYSRASIFVMTSAYEGFGNTVVEAQSYGAVPFLFDTYAVARWIVDNGTNGFLIEPFNIVKMAEKIEAFAKMSHEEQLELQNYALENARRFDISIIGDKWEELLKELDGD